MARDTLLGFPAHTLPYRRGKFITLSTASGTLFSRGCLFQFDFVYRCRTRSRISCVRPWFQNWVPI